MSTPFEQIDSLVPEKSMLSPRDVSECSGLSIQTLAERRMNQIPPDFIRLSSRRVAYPRPVIVDWLASRYVSTTAPASRTR